jgi:hypothetical protein
VTRAPGSSTPSRLLNAASASRTTVDDPLAMGIGPSRDRHRAGQERVSLAATRSGTTPPASRTIACARENSTRRCPVRAAAAGQLAFAQRPQSRHVSRPCDRPRLHSPLAPCCSPHGFPYGARPPAHSFSGCRDADSAGPLIPTPRVRTVPRFGSAPICEVTGEGSHMPAARDAHTLG